MSLVSEAKGAPPWRGRREGSKWLRYREAFRVLVEEKGYPKAQACRWIAEREGLSDVDADRFYEAARKWEVDMDRGGEEG